MARRSRPNVAPQAALLIIAIAYGAFAQGAFFGSQLAILQLLIAGALATALARQRPSPDDLTSPAAVAAGLVIAATIASGAIAGHLTNSLPQIAFVLTLLAVVVVVRRTTRSDREAVFAATTALGTAVGLWGWLSVAYRLTPGALRNGALWRASTTITYANGAACFIAMCVLLALARMIRFPEERVTRIVFFALLVGLGATFSRGAALALVAGGLWLTIHAGLRTLVRTAWPAIVGAIVAFVGLLPSFAAAGHPHPAVASLALLLGVAVAWFGNATRRHLVAIVLMSGAVVLLIVVATPVRREVTEIRRARLAQDISVHDREARWSDFVRIGLTRPVLGAGPGSFVLRYDPRASDQLDVGRFAHNEYLQVFAEQGFVGLAALLAAIALMARALSRSRRDDWIWLGGSSALLVFLTQGATDFVWNIPLIPFVGAVVWAAAADDAGSGSASTAGHIGQAGLH